MRQLIKVTIFVLFMLPCLLLGHASVSSAAGNYTIEFEYHPAHLNNPGSGSSFSSDVSHAVTRHYDGYRQAGDTVDTVLFIDGLKRVVQTKKDQTVGDQDVMVVSGRVKFDFAGRVIEQRYPTIENKGSDRVFNRPADSVRPTLYAYDVLDRQTSIQLPDANYTTMTYGFGPNRNNQIQFKTVVRDAENKEKRTYKDVRNLITSVTELNQGASIQTSYRYDALKQIVQVRDAKNNLL